MSSPRVADEFVLNRCDAFVDMQVWPTRDVVDARGWLANFTDDELEHALCLLNSFMFYSEKFVNRLFLSAFLSLRSQFRFTQKAWCDFSEHLVVTYVSGEKPKATDSGYTFARKARQVLSVNEEMILQHDELIDKIKSGLKFPIVFVDDFVGSGEQITKTLEMLNSCLGVDITEQLDTFYTPLLATQSGIEDVAIQFPSLKISPANILTDRYSVFSPDSVVWPDHLRPSSTDFIRTACYRAGIGTAWRGFRGLGLAVAFSHGVPDATLPLFHHECNNWKPLVRRV